MAADIASVYCDQQEEPIAEAGPSSGAGGEGLGERRPRHKEQTRSHIADMLGAMAAHQQLER